MGMLRRSFLSSAAMTPLAAQSAIEDVTCDVFVYGSTPGGVAAAVEAARRGARTILACPQLHPGGMAASGLSTTDAVRPQLFGGLVAEFVALVRDHYVRELSGNPAELALVRDGWFYEPSVAQEAFQKLIEGAHERLRWLPAHWLNATAVKDRKVLSVEIEDASRRPFRVSARTFIDGTYEGDLAAAAKVPYRVGREGRAEYGERFAGIHYMNWRTGEQILTPDTCGSR